MIEFNKQQCSETKRRGEDAWNIVPTLQLTWSSPLAFLLRASYHSLTLSVSMGLHSNGCIVFHIYAHHIYVFQRLNKFTNFRP